MSGKTLQRSEITDSIRQGVTQAFTDAGFKIEYGAENDKNVEVVITKPDGTTVTGELKSHFTTNDHITQVKNGRITELVVNGDTNIVFSEEPEGEAVSPALIPSMQ